MGNVIEFGPRRGKPQQTSETEVDGDAHKATTLHNVEFMSTLVTWPSYPGTPGSAPTIQTYFAANVAMSEIATAVALLAAAKRYAEDANKLSAKVLTAVDVKLPAVGKKIAVEECVLTVCDIRDGYVTYDEEIDGSTTRATIELNRWPQRVVGGKLLAVAGYSIQATTEKLNKLIETCPSSFTQNTADGGYFVVWRFGPQVQAIVFVTSVGIATCSIRGLTLEPGLNFAFDQFTELEFSPIAMLALRYGPALK